MMRGKNRAKNIFLLIPARNPVRYTSAPRTSTPQPCRRLFPIFRRPARRHSTYFFTSFLYFRFHFSFLLFLSRSPRFSRFPSALSCSALSSLSPFPFSFLPLFHFSFFALPAVFSSCPLPLPFFCASRPDFSPFLPGFPVPSPISCPILCFLFRFSLSFPVVFLFPPSSCAKRKNSRAPRQFCRGARPEIN